MEASVLKKKQINIVVSDIALPESKEQTDDYSESENPSAINLLRVNIIL
jgi:hypothetical protein